MGWSATLTRSITWRDRTDLGSWRRRNNFENHLLLLFTHALCLCVSPRYLETERSIMRNHRPRGFGLQASVAERRFALPPETRGMPCLRSTSITDPHETASAGPPGLGPKSSASSS